MGMNWIFTKVILAGIILGILTLPAGAKGAKYEVGIREGLVVVRDLEEEQLFYTLTPAELLPPEDRALLEAGIFCENRRELSQVLENFCS